MVHAGRRLRETGRRLVGMRRGRQNPDGTITDLGPANGGATRRFGNNNSVRPPGGNITCAGWQYGVPPHGPQPPARPLT